MATPPQNTADPEKTQLQKLQNAEVTLLTMEKEEVVVYHNPLWRWATARVGQDAKAPS